MEITSLEASLTDRYSDPLELAELSRHEAKQHLARIATLYSGQLHIDFTEPAEWQPNDAA
jgi:hypothetical protein